MWAFVNLRAHPPGAPLLDRMAYQAVKLMHNSSPQNLANILWAYARLEGSRSHPLLPTVARFVRSERFSKVKGGFRILFRRTSPSLLSAGATNELLLENNVACDMPWQIPYISWLILIMPLSTSMLNCAISFGKRRAGEFFYSNRSA